MAFPKVSVLMNCLNGGRYLREAFDSVFAQTYKDWEIIFWDNASTDNSVEIARSYGDRVRVFNSVSTQVLGRARNFAVNQARGKYIAFLDCDDIWLPQKLEKQMALFENDPELGLVFSDVFSFLLFEGQAQKTVTAEVSEPRHGAMERGAPVHFQQRIVSVLFCLSDLINIHPGYFSVCP